jgi:hypothetical protein
MSPLIRLFTPVALIMFGLLPSSLDAATIAGAGEQGSGISVEMDFSWAPTPISPIDPNGANWSNADFCGISYVQLSYANQSMGACHVYYDKKSSNWMLQSGPNAGWQICRAVCMKH